MGNAIAVNDQNFENEVLQAGLPVLVDFWAPWCQPCLRLGPTVDAIADEFAGRLKVVKLNTDEAVEVATKYGVMTIPTLMIFKGGDMITYIRGNRSRPELVKFVSEHV